jgi:wyosine [tRNA(Phe)-imidazoG37] synthetase (radical SAM superfamily)
MKQSTKHFGHHLVQDIVYGPVTSRRFGTTLGINLLPATQKHCSFDCIYCQLGWTPKETHKEKLTFPSPEQVITELKNKLEDLESSKISIVLSGNGEPTLYPEFTEMVDKLLSARKTFDKNMPIICFTNGTTLKNDSIRKALARIDECCVKADPNFSEINLPCQAYDFLQQKTYLRELPNLVLQACLLTGSKDNSTETIIANWITTLKDLTPNRIDLYTLSRKTPHTGLEAVSLERLEEIKEHLRKDFSCPITVSASV